MARKKTRQQDPNDSSDSGDGNGGGQGSATACACKHISRAVQLGAVKKKLKGGIRTSCDSCAKKSKIANIVPDVSLSNGDELLDPNWTYWLCLTCAHIGCGRGQHKHAIAHYDTPRSEQHDLVVDIESWNVWCYTCEQKMAFNSTKKLQECVEYIRRHMQSSKLVDLPPVSNDNSVNVLQIEPSAVKSSTASAVNGKEIEVKSSTVINSSKVRVKPVKVRGLMNLGNTCFYNSVLQCLSVTPFLTKTLEKLICSGEEFVLPGDVNSEKFEVPKVCGQLGDSGPLSCALLSTLLELRSPDMHADTIRPQKLLKQVQDSFSQFRGNEQHDAHELLRHLLEGVRSDDLKRFQRVILKQHGILGLNKNDAVDDHVKKRMKLYGQQLQDFILGVEGIFKGQLVSIVECQDCKHHSTRFESFLDLSLPVMEDKPLPPMRKKEQAESFVNDSGPSKYQAKKQKKAARRNNKSQKHKRSEKMDGCLTILEESVMSPEGPESEESDADVEDNVEQDSVETAENKEVVESGYSSEKQNTGESDGTSPSITTGNEEAPTSPTASGSPVAPESPTAPVSASASGSPSPIVCRKASVPNEDWSTFHTPEHVCSGSPCMYSCKANGEMRCFTPIDEELRITIPESGEGSIHISPVSNSERPMSRRSYLPGDICVGKTTDLAPELEDRLLSLCLNENQKAAPYSTSPSTTLANEDTCLAEDATNSNKKVCIQKENAVNLQVMRGEIRNNNDNFEKASNSEKEPEDETSIVQSTLENKEDVSGWCKTLAPRQQSEEGDCSVMSCLNQFTSLELMTGNNKVGCDACTRRQTKGSESKTVYTNSTKQFLISSPPPVLILHLKRFMMENFRFKKLQRFVSFPLELDIAPFCSTKCKDTPSIGESQTEVRYSLFGIVEHTGSLNTGHYVAYIKIRANLEENDPRWSYLPLTREFVYPHVDGSTMISTKVDDSHEKWYSISDSRVVEIAEAKVLKVQAYLLFYERIV